MCLSIETIRIEGERICNLPYHNERLNRTRKALFGVETEIDLAALIDPRGYRERTRCRVEYAESIREIAFAPYVIRPIHSLQVVRCDGLDYGYKAADRRPLDTLFAQRGVCSDVLLLREGLLTDTSICNVAFGNRSGWVTPRQPLLCGTKRASLLDAGILTEEDITVDMLGLYSSVRLFNALIGFGEVTLDISRIQLPAYKRT